MGDVVIKDAKGNVRLRFTHEDFLTRGEDVLYLGKELPVDQALAQELHVKIDGLIHCSDIAGEEARFGGHNAHTHTRYLPTGQTVQMFTRTDKGKNGWDDLGRDVKAEHEKGK